MAVSGRKQDKMDDSVAGSQSFYELACEPCHREDGKHIKAVAYCHGCDDYFCHTCVKYHRRFGLKDHILLEGDKMPKTLPPKGKEMTVKGRRQCPKCSSERQKVELTCGHELCQDCAREQINQERPCLDCGVITGSQPQGSVDTKDYTQTYIKMTFKFPDGIQMSHHPLPGQKYRGKTLVCFLENDDKGQSICKLLQIAFDRKLIGKIQDGTVCDNVGLFDKDPPLFPRLWMSSPIGWIPWDVSYNEWLPNIINRLAALGIRA